MNGPAAKIVTLNADDFGLSDGVDSAIADLAAMGRIHAISCMTAPLRWPAAARRLSDLPRGVSVGLHLTLTALPEAGPMASGTFLPDDPGPAGLLVRAFLGQIGRKEFVARVDRQLDLFEEAVGRPPDHIDGHQHAQAVLGVPAILYEVLQRRYGQALPWIRATAPCLPAAPGSALRRWVIAGLGRYQRRKLATTPLKSNRAFGGIRGFAEQQPYADLLQRQLALAPSSGALIMCHPGAAPTLPGDPIAGARLAEFAVLAGPELPLILARANCRLGPLEPGFW